MFEIDVGLATVADKIFDVHCIEPICDKGIHSPHGCSGRGCKKCRHSLRFQVRSTVIWNLLILFIMHSKENSIKNYSTLLSTKVVYMFSSFWLLAVESHDFSQAEKKRTACKADLSHKMTYILTQNDNKEPF